MANTSQANSTVPWIQTNLNVAPYFNDYDENKKYEMLLFKPGVGVQTRELNALQSTIQRQNARIASSLFQEGSRVKGGAFNIDLNAVYLRVKDKTIYNASVVVANFIGRIITGQSSGVKAQVILVQDGLESTTPNTKTLIIKYISASSDGVTKTFSAGEEIVSNNGFRATIINDVSAIGNASFMSIDKGSFFVRGFPVLFDGGSIILDAYSNTPSCRIGFTISENIITYLDDDSLLSNATGEPNYAAPGADRLQLMMSLRKFSLTETLPSGYVELAVIKDGILQTVSPRTQYNDIMDELARRTYSQSGDYVINGMQVTVKDCLDTGFNNGYLSANNGGNTYQLAIGVQPGEAYTKGYDVQYLVTQWNTVDKGIDYVNVDNAILQTNYGNYITVNEFAGTFDRINGTTVNLYDTAQQCLTNRTYISGSYSGSIIGTARVRDVEIVSGNFGDPTASYNVYLYDLNMTANNFTSIKSIVSSTGVCDCVLAANNAVLNDASFNTSLFPLSLNAIRNVKNANNNSSNSYEFLQSFSVTISSAGTFSISSSYVDEVFPYATGALSSSQLKDFEIIFNNSAKVTLSGTINVTSGNTTVVGTGTSFSSQLRANDKITFGSSTYRIQSIASNTQLTLSSTPSVSASANTFYKQYFVGDIVPMNVNGSNGSARSITVNSSTSVSFNLQETLDANKTATVYCKMSKLNAREKRKVLAAGRYVIIDTQTHTANTVGPWSLGVSDVRSENFKVRTSTTAFTSNTQGTDVTSYFVLDNGQKVSHYDLASIKLNGSPSLGRYLLVQFDYFQHDFSQGSCFFTADSYPIDDTTYSSNTSIRTEQIPIFVSQSDGSIHSLRQSIDFRPSKNNTASDTTVVSSASVNPSAASTFNVPTGGLHFPVVDSIFNTSFSYYLGRKDLVSITPSGTVNIVRGKPSTSPITPSNVSDAMDIAVVYIPPYPSLTSDVTSTWTGNRVYTMRDIGMLDKRVSALEYYSSLNLLEQSANSLQITDSNGLNRFKNGFLVDAFTGSSVVNVFDTEYQCSIDTKKQTLRPKFTLNQLSLTYDGANANNVALSSNAATLFVSNTSIFSVGDVVYQGNSTNNTASAIVTGIASGKIFIENINGAFVLNGTISGSKNANTCTVNSISKTSNGSLISLPYENKLFISQPYATTTRNAAGLNWDWVGSLTLYPDNDYWVDTKTNPDVVVNLANNNDNWLYANIAFETQWNSWQTVWSGVTQSSLSTYTVDADGQYRQAIIDYARQYGAQGRNALGTLNDLSTLINRGWGWEVKATIATGTETVSTVQQRTGTQSSINWTSQTTNMGNYITDSTLNPYMRSRPIMFAAQGMKPNARLYAFFDNVDINAYCAPISGYSFVDSNLVVSSSGAYVPAASLPIGDANTSGILSLKIGDPLITDANGSLVGVFYLPNDSSRRFTVGTKKLRLSDSVTNSSEQGQVTTSAETSYSAQGITNTSSDLIVSTRVPTLSTKQVSQTQTLTSTRNVNGIQSVQVNDPIVQTFQVSIPDSPNSPGVFVTRLDLFFASKDTFLPATISFVEIDNSTSQVTGNTVPLSLKTLYPSQINVSDDASQPTPVYFDSPIFLKTDRQYGFKVFPGGSNPNYSIWVAQLGENDIASKTRVISQPLSGTLFISSNDKTYSAVSDEQAKFNLYVANFNTSVTGTIQLYNDPNEFLILSGTSSAGFVVSGEPIFNLPSLTIDNLSNGSIIVGQTVTGITSNTSGIITSYSNNVIVVANTADNSNFSVSEKIVFSYANGMATGAYANVGSVSQAHGLQYDFNGNRLSLNNLGNTQFANNDTIVGKINKRVGYVSGFDHIKYDVHQPFIGSLVFSQTQLSFGAKLVSNTGTIDSAFSDVQINTNNKCLGQKYIFTNSYEKNTLHDHSYILRGTLKTSDKYISPIVDLSRLGVILVGNVINNDYTNETNPHGGNAIAKYTTRITSLTEGMDAGDLRVYLTLYRPSGTDVLVYAKLVNYEDSVSIGDQNWLLLNSDATKYSDIHNENDLIEVLYTLPTSVMTGVHGDYQYTNKNGVIFTKYRNYAIKIVMVSNDTSVVPYVQNLRALALSV